MKLLVEFTQSRAPYGSRKIIWVNPDKVMTVEPSQHPKTHEPDTLIRLAEGGAGGATVYVTGDPSTVVHQLKGGEA